MSKSSTNVHAEEIEDLEEKVKKLARLALFNETSRKPLKREDIVSKGFFNPSLPKAPVLQSTQELLRHVFGFELVELDPDGGKKEVYVLRNALPEEILNLGLIRFSKEESAFMGFVTLILALIMVNGGSLPDGVFIGYMKRLGFTTGQGQGGGGGQLRNLDETLQRAIDQRYVNKIARNAQQHHEKLRKNDTGSFELVWGPRAETDLGKKNLTEFILKVFGPDAPNTLRQDIERALGERSRE